jgi:AraC-like DNA-binding protein
LDALAIQGVKNVQDGGGVAGLRLPMERDHPRMWNAAGIGGLDMLEASFGRQSCPRHSHDTYGIGVVHAGANRFTYRGGRHVAPSGFVCTVTYDEVHAGEVTEEGLAYRCLYPAPALVNAVASELRESTENRIFALPPVIGDAVVAHMVNAFFEAEHAGEPLLARQTLLSGLLTRVLVRHAVERVEPRHLDANGRAVARARSYLHDNLTGDVSLDQLAEVAETRPFRLIRAFNRLHGLPPHAYLTQLRVRRARDLIGAGHPLAEVAAAVGFADQSHLNRHFKRILGVTPGRYGHRG